MAYPLIVVETPFRAGQGYTKSENEAFAESICRSLALSGYNPFASHLLYPRFLKDNVEGERGRGMYFGFEIGKHAREAHFYLRRSSAGKMEDMSRGMAWALVQYKRLGKPITIYRCHPDGQIIAVEEKISPQEQDEEDGGA